LTGSNGSQNVSGSCGSPVPVSQDDVCSAQALSNFFCSGNGGSGGFLSEMMSGLQAELTRMGQLGACQQQGSGSQQNCGWSDQSHGNTMGGTWSSCDGSQQNMQTMQFAQFQH
jgi:hypothetical protein